MEVHGNDINPTVQEVLIREVSDFVDTVWREHNADGTKSDQRQKSEVSVPGLQDARTRTDAAIIKAEKFCAKVDTPPGMLVVDNSQCHNVIGESNCEQHGARAVLPFMGGPVNNQVTILDHSRAVGEGLSDDDFFHLTSHVDPLLKQKIERGEFVDLDKLLSKDHFGVLNRYSEESRMEWVQHDGGTFLVPARHETQITNFRRWEQAFRMYATIYCGANPHRAKEIWQYISVINTASSAYVWENVYGYDVTFRQLMAFNPNRSWAVTYNQMWNLSMREPIQRNGYGSWGHNGNFQNGFNNSNPKNGKVNGNNAGSTGQPNKKSKYCWAFNKGVPCNFGKSCAFVERCRYCDSPAHGIYACPKLLNKEGEKKVKDKA